MKKINSGFQIGGLYFRQVAHPDDKNREQHGNHRHKEIHAIKNLDTIDVGSQVRHE
jgi:hypothetical protein